MKFKGISYKEALLKDLNKTYRIDFVLNGNQHCLGETLLDFQKTLCEKDYLEMASIMKSAKISEL